MEFVFVLLRVNGTRFFFPYSFCFFAYSIRLSGVCALDNKQLPFFILNTFCRFTSINQTGIFSMSSLSLSLALSLVPSFFFDILIVQNEWKIQAHTHTLPARDRRTDTKIFVITIGRNWTTMECCTTNVRSFAR